MDSKVMMTASVVIRVRGVAVGVGEDTSVLTCLMGV